MKKMMMMMERQRFFAHVAAAAPQPWVTTASSTSLCIKEEHITITPHRHFQTEPEQRGRMTPVPSRYQEEQQ
jgi:hypothetical protein